MEGRWAEFFVSMSQAYLRRCRATYLHRRSKEESRSTMSTASKTGEASVNHLLTPGTQRWDTVYPTFKGVWSVVVHCTPWLPLISDLGCQGGAGQACGGSGGPIVASPPTAHGRGTRVELLTRCARHHPSGCDRRPDCRPPYRALCRGRALPTHQALPGLWALTEWAGSPS